MMAVFTYPFWIFFARTLDRIGKGVRTGARDAMLSDEALPGTKGKVFGFHRALDTLGAAIGPAMALIYLYFFPGEYKTLFYLAFLPGLAAIILSFFLKEKAHSNPAAKRPESFFTFIKYWKKSPKIYRKVVIGLLAFALFNSSDMFLLLRIKEAGLGDSAVIGVYIFYNLVYALFSFPAGVIADKLGFKKTFISGLVLFVIVYGGMSVKTNIYVYAALFFIYGIYAASTEGISKAWISSITDKKDTATAIGTYAGFQSICAMFASTITGLIWYRFGYSAAFISTAVVTSAVVIYFIFLQKK